MRALPAACSRRLRCGTLLKPAARRNTYRHVHTPTKAPTLLAVADPPAPENPLDTLDEPDHGPRRSALSLAARTRPIQLPPHSARRNPAAWASAIEPYLPARLKTAHPRWPLQLDHANVRVEDLPQLLLQARNQQSIDVLTDLALEEGRWDAMLWISDIILQLCKSEDPPTNDAAILRSIQWPKRMFLDDWTADRKQLRDIHTRDAFRTSELRIPSIAEYTSKPRSTAHIASWPDRQKHIGLVWTAIGNLIIKASGQTERECYTTMRFALRLLGQLHYHGYIPPKVYEDPSPEGTMGVYQPALISEISGAIMSALFDAAVEDVADDGHALSDLKRANPFVRLDVGPEMWMEFVLWCCVRGGWLLEASSILNNLRKRKGRHAWHLLCWRKLESSPEATLDDLSRRRRAAYQRSQPDINSGEDHLEGSGSTARTVSSEVVVALIDALASAVNTLALREKSLKPIFERLSQLNNLLSREQMGLGSLTWDEIIARFSNLPTFDIDQDPGLLESFLVSLAETYGRKAVVSNDPDRHSSYSSCGTAIILGLFHRTLRAYIRRHDVGRALKVLKSLQAFADKNKNQAVEGFARKMRGSAQQKRRISQEVFTPDTQRDASFDYPAFFPRIPPAILAELLDLLTENDLVDVGQWMVHSEDIDGPLIPASMYSDGAVAPSLFRFAIQTHDLKLLSRVMNAQPSALSMTALIAICESRIKLGQWKNSTQVLRMIKGYSEFQWSVANFASMTGALIPFLSDNANNVDKQEASNVLQALFRGDFGRLQKFGSAQAIGIASVLCTAHQNLAALCSPMLRRATLYSISLSQETFDVLLASCMAAYGSKKGMELWRTWCDVESPSRDVPVDHSDSWPGASAGSAVEMFSAQKIQTPSSADDARMVTVTGCVQPSLSSLRIIFGQAWKEVRGGMGAQMTYAESKKLRMSDAVAVLAWAEQELQSTFGLSHDHAVAELEGVSPSENRFPLPRSVYGDATVHVWRRLRDARLLPEGEQKLRELVMSRTEKQVTFHALSSIERKFVYELAADLGLAAESFGEEPERGVEVVKTPTTPEMPPMTVGEWYETTHSKAQEALNVQ